MHYKETTYERVANNLLKNQQKHIPTAEFIDGRLHKGWKSLHNTIQSRTWRLFWRLKQFNGLSISNVCNDKQYTDIVWDCVQV